MARTETYICDVCGVQKKGTNHWWFAMVGLETEDFNPNFDLRTWIAEKIPEWNDEAAYGEVEVKHLCGEKCVIQVVSEFMGKVRK